MSVMRTAYSIGALCLLAAVMLTITPEASANGQLTVDSGDLAAAQRIRSETTTRYADAPGRKLAVTESSSTRVVESFTLLSGPMLEARIVPADNGVYYAICPRGATCPYPGRRLARPATDFLPRRQALELAVRTFLETSVNVVAVSLPTPRFILFIVERDELTREVDISALGRRLTSNPARAPAAELQGIVDQVTRPRLFVALGLEPTPNGRDTWTGVARWPTIGSPHSFEPAFAESRIVASPREEITLVSGVVHQTGKLALRGDIEFVSRPSICSTSDPPTAVCHGRTGTARVPGLGQVTETYVFVADDSQCPNVAWKVLAYPVVLTVAGKGDLNLAVAAKPECLPAQSVPGASPQSFTVTGGSGVFAGASGGGTLTRDAGPPGASVTGVDTWAGSLTVPELEFDVIAPVISGATSKVVRAPKKAKRLRVRYRISASDNVDGATEVTCRPGSGSWFKIGRTAVKCIAIDGSGNTATATFTVTVAQRR